MIVKKFKNGNINLKLEDEKTIEDILHSDDLFWADLRFETFGNEWFYIVDDSTGLVYMFTDYAFNYFAELLQGKTIKLVPCGKIEEYEIIGG